MRKLWLLFLVGLATSFFGERLLVSSQSPFSTDDMYLEGRPSGDVPVDDEDNQDGGSGSGSGDYDEIIWFTQGSETPAQPQSTAESFHSTPTRAPESQDQKTTVKPPPYIIPNSNKEKQVPGEKSPKGTSPTVTEMPFREQDNVDEVFTEETILHKQGRGSMYEQFPEQVSTENMWERTEVLAAVIACGVVGFLCAVFLLLLLAYRMKKKDEGSYDLGDTKLSTTAYHKAPTKEFYA